MLTAANLVFQAGRRVLIDRVSARFEPTQLHLIIGPNGTPMPDDPRMVSTDFPLGTPKMSHVLIQAAVWPQVLAAMQGAVK